MKTYTELILLPTFMERFNYLKLDGVKFQATFGIDRYLNQIFYHTSEWKSVRNFIITRDNGCDLGIHDRHIQGKIFIHHLNPITIDDITYRRDKLLDPDNLISVCYNTHQAIHYGNLNLIIPDEVPERHPNDTCPWKE